MSPEAETKSKLFTSEYIFHTLIFFCVVCNFLVLVNTMPIYVMDKMNMNEAQAGVIVGILAIGILVSRFISGRLALIVGYKKLLLIGIIGTLILSTMYLFATTSLSLHIVRLLHGFFFGLTTNTNMTIVANIIPRERSGEGVGYYSLGQVISTAIGPLIGLSLAMRGMYTQVFILGALMMVICLVVFPLLHIKDISVDEKKSALKEGGKGFSSIFDTKVLAIAILAFFLCMGTTGTSSFMGPYAESINIPKAALMFFPVNAAVILVTRPFVSKMYDKRGANTVLFPAMISYAIGLFIAGQAQSTFPLLLAAALIGLGFGAITSSLLTIVVQLVPRTRISVANATYFMFFDSSAALGPIIMGIIISLWDFRGMFIVSGIIIVFCIPAYYIFHARKHKGRIET